MAKTSVGGGVDCCHGSVPWVQALCGMYGLCVSAQWKLPPPAFTQHSAPRIYTVACKTCHQTFVYTFANIDGF